MSTEELKERSIAANGRVLGKRPAAAAKFREKSGATGRRGRDKWKLYQNS